jgi:hypothetical protein
LLSLTTSVGNGLFDLLCSTVDPGRRELEVIEEVEDLKRQLQYLLHEPRRWFGSLRRVSKARAIQGSNSIEEPIDADADAETALALRGYRDAMTYVLQLASDESFDYSEQLLKSLHFMMTRAELDQVPGPSQPGRDPSIP